MATDHHWAVLSLTRFGLAMIVLCGHIFWDVKGGDDWTYFGLWFNQGSAVFGFLILSGYSIAASLERSPKGFYPRRFIRIWPIYLLSVLLALAIVWYIGGGFTFPSGRYVKPPTLLQMGATIFMLQTFIAKPIPIGGQLWTLAIEWWLYMVAPLLNKFLTVIIALLIACSLGYNIILQPTDASKLVHGQSLFCLSWYWLIGFSYYKHKRTWQGYAILFIPIILAACSNIFMGRAVVIGLFAVVLCPYIRIPKKMIPAMNWLGDLSYPIYCLHAPLLVLCVCCNVHASLLICFIVLCASAASLYLVDFPVRKWAKKRHDYLQINPQ